MRSSRTSVMLASALVAALALSACKPGKGSDDTLADGAIDRPSASNGSTGIGPGAPPVDSAGPGEGDNASVPASQTPATPAGPAEPVAPPATAPAAAAPTPAGG